MSRKLLINREHISLVRADYAQYDRHSHDGAYYQSRERIAGADLWQMQQLLLQFDGFQEAISELAAFKTETPKYWAGVAHNYLDSYKRQLLQLIYAINRDPHGAASKRETRLREQCGKAMLTVDEVKQQLDRNIIPDATVMDNITTIQKKIEKFALPTLYTLSVGLLGFNKQWRIHR